MCNEFFEVGIEGGKVGMGGNGMKRGMISMVALIFPNMDWNKGSQLRSEI